MGVVTELDGLENFQRDGGSFARNISGHHDRRPKLPERARERENNAGDNPAAREWQGDGEKDSQRTCSKGARDVFESLIHSLKSGARGADEQRQRHDGEGKDNGLPREDNIEAEFPEGTFATEKMQQDQ